MSPPTKAPPDSERENASRSGATPRLEPASPAPALAPPHAAVVAGQQTAGNRAIVAALGGSGLQRAPNDDPRRTSGMAHAPTLDNSGGVATAPTLPGTQPTDQRRTSGMAHGPTLDSAGGAATGPTLPGGDSPLSGPTPAPAGSPAGGAAARPGTIVSGADDDGGASAPARGGGRGPGHGLTDNSIADAHRANPGSVHRAINYAWYDWMLDQQKVTGDDYPRGIRVGPAVVVAPDYDGPGPPPRVGPIEEPDDERKMQPGDPVPGDPRLAQGPRQQQPDLTDPNAKRALFPGSRRGPEPGMKAAQPVTHDEVMKAYRDNPASVHPSTDDEWHKNVYYDVDRGQGELPRAYRSGNTIIVDPSYPLDGRPPTASPPGSVKMPGPGADLGSVLKPRPTDPTAKPAPSRDREETKGERPIPKAMSTIAPAPINPELEGDIPRDQKVRYDDDSPDIEIESEEKKPAKWGTSGANATRQSATERKRSTRRTTETTTNTKTMTGGAGGAGHEWRQRDEVKTDDKVVGKERYRKVNANLEGLTFTTGQSTDEGKGETADPANPDSAQKTKTNVQAGGTIGPGGASGTGTASIESKTGAKAEAKGTVKLGKEGIEATGTGSFTTAKGFTGHLSVSGKSHVVAGDPKKLENGTFSVTFTVTDEKGVELGGGWSKPGGGGPSVNFAAGSTTSTAQFETRVFTTEGEAKMFQLTAAMHVSTEIDSVRKATTADGALEMKEGESRGSSQTDTDTIGGSAGLEGVDVGVGKSDATTRGLTIKKVGPTTIQVTPSISEKKALDASISAWGAFGNTKGESEINAFAVTYEFDLGNDAAKKAFEEYCKHRFPPPMPPNARWIDSTTGHQIEDHDVYKFAHIGEIGYQDSAWQQTVVDEAGTHAAAGGGQSHKVDLNWVRHLTFDENVHSEVEVTGRLENGKTAGFAGKMTVGGESGSYNRDAFRKVFMDTKAPDGAKVTNSGEWTLSADIDAKMFEQLEQLNGDMRKAKTREEKLKIYSELAKKGGAQMLMGQVRGSGKKLAWNLELKGDPNFPGAAGREKLEHQRLALTEQLKSKPDSAGSVIREAKDTLEALNKRLAGVRDVKKYTDLPDELRTEQVEVIKSHIAQFESLQSQAASLAMRGGNKDGIDVIRARATKNDGYKDLKPAEREVKQVRDSIQLKETDIAVIAREIQGTHGILGRMRNARGDVMRFRDENTEVKQTVYMDHNSRMKDALSLAVRYDEFLKASAAKARDLRKQWDAGGDPQTWLTALRALDKELKEQKEAAKDELESLQDAVREAYLITTDEAIGRDWAYFKSIKADSAARSIAISGFDED